MRLSSSRLEVEIDPSHGAELVSLHERDGGRELLGRTPWDPAPPLDDELDEHAWTRAYRGGWQLLTPNAGDACEAGGTRHGFHGRASHAPWEVLARREDEAVLRWAGHGLVVTRGVRVRGGTVEAATRWEALRDAVPMVHVEHVAFGPALLDPEVELRLPGGSAERFSFAHDRAAFSVLREFAVGAAELVNVASGLCVQVEWDADALPFAWVWHELRGSGDVWDRRTEILGFEPASTAQPGGLAQAIERGEATWVEPGRPLERRIALHVSHEREA